MTNTLLNRQINAANISSQFYLGRLGEELTEYPLLNNFTDLPSKAPSPVNTTLHVLIQNTSLPGGMFNICLSLFFYQRHLFFETQYICQIKSFSSLQKNKFTIGFFILVLIGYGVYEVKKLPIDAVPDITDNQVQVITKFFCGTLCYEGAATPNTFKRIESTICFTAFLKI